MTMTILVTGCNGMLAHDLVPVLEAEGHVCITTDRQTLDITSMDGLNNFFSSHHIDIVINCAAYTAVDDAEDVGTMSNYTVNGLSVGGLASVCCDHGSKLIHISTDYVFDGQNEAGYLPNETRHPLNEYGKAKHLGERLAQQEYPDTIIVRTSWLYGGGSAFKNFVNTMIRLGNEKDELSVVNDQYGLPTYTMDLADGLCSIVANIDSYSGFIFHLSNTGESAITRYDFACTVFQTINNTTIAVFPCDSDMYPTKAQRPQHSLLLNDSDIILPHWRDGLHRYIATL